MTDRSGSEVVGDLDPFQAERFSAEKSVRYHKRRFAFFQAWHRGLMLFALVTGSTGFFEMFGAPSWVAFVAFVLVAIDVLWSPSVRAREHELLCGRFSKLKQRIEGTAHPTEDDLRSWRVQRSELEDEEIGSPFWGLEADCFNETQRAWGRPSRVVHLAWWRRLTMNYLHHNSIK